jgi:hypothetical protein
MTTKTLSPETIAALESFKSATVFKTTLIRWYAAMHPSQGFHFEVRKEGTEAVVVLNFEIEGDVEEFFKELYDALREAHRFTHRLTSATRVGDYN